MEKQKNIPQLRFPEFNGEWEMYKIGKLFYVSAGGDIPKENVNNIQNDIFKYPIYANAEKHKGLFGYSNIYRIDKDVVTIAGRGVNMGIAHARKEKFYPIVRLLVLVPKKISSVEFFEFAINRINFFVESTGVPQLTAPQVSTYQISYPAFPEQQKIASFFTAIDEKITQLKQKKTLLEQYKKGVMQKIFSQEIRFKDDNGQEFPKWEKKKLGDCLDYIQPTKYIVTTTEYDNSYQTPVLTAGKSFILGYTNETEGIYNNGLPVIIFDDFTTSTQFVDFAFKVKSSAMKILVTKLNVNIKFIFEAMQTLNYEIGGHERHWISKFAPMGIDLPSLPEQTKIANFLSAIDGKIKQTQKQIEKAETWKNGLLQQMFV